MNETLPPESGVTPARKTLSAEDDANQFLTPLMTQLESFQANVWNAQVVIGLQQEATEKLRKENADLRTRLREAEAKLANVPKASDTPEAVLLPKASCGFLTVVQDLDEEKRLEPQNITDSINGLQDINARLASCARDFLAVNRSLRRLSTKEKETLTLRIALRATSESIRHLQSLFDRRET